MITVSVGQVLGALMLLSGLVALIVFSVRAMGGREAAKMWTFTFSVTAFIIVAAGLLTDWDWS